MKRALALTALLLVSVASLVPAQTPPPSDSTAGEHAGLLFDAEFSPLATSVSPLGGYWVTVGVGYRADARISFLLQIITGYQFLDEGSARPVWGRFLPGGARLEGTFSFLERLRWHPYLFLDYGLYTILNQHGLGYNGRGPGLGVGVETDISRYFGFRAGVEYRRIFYYSPVSDTDPAGAFDPFAIEQVGIAVRITFNPSF